MSDAPPSDEELRAAAALAEALDSRDPMSGPADDALATAQLLRYARTGGELDEVAIARGRARLAKHGNRLRFSPAAFLAVPIACVLLLICMIRVLSQDPRRPTTVEAPVDHRIPAEVLAAQTRAITFHDPGAIERPMHDYRSRLFAGLDQKYGAGK